ncbi:MAG: anthranilate synthase component I family protein [Desulfohalobiaceae bacterium]
MQEISLTQHSRLYPADTQTPISLYLDLVGEQPGILLESAEVDGRLGRYSLISWDFQLLLQSRQGRMHLEIQNPLLAELQEHQGQDFLPALRQILRRLQLMPPQDMDAPPALTRSLQGYFGYELSALLEPKLGQVLPRQNEETCLVLPGRQILFDHLHHRCLFISLSPEDSPAAAPGSRLEEGFSLGQVENTPDQETFCSRVAQTRELINSGEAIQVVLSTRFVADFQGQPFTLYRRLRQTNPSPYMFYLNLPELTLIGSSPELLVRCDQGLLQERPIAGTRPRGMSQDQDARLAEELLQDPKERAEHVMLVDLGRNDLGRISQAGSVQVEKFMQVERFSHVMHLTSYLRSSLQPDLDAVDVLRAAFPAGTVSGAPKIRAMEIISQMEDQPRGPYAGAVGWLGLDPGEVSLDTGITIRSMWLKNGKLCWQAGAGIVSDSDPKKEWQECQNKARVIKQILSQGEASDAFTHR